MKMNTDERESWDSRSEQVLAAVVEVSNILSAGFLEKDYPRALLAERRPRSVRTTAEVSSAVRLFLPPHG
jgi:hypothetical protein